MPEYFWSEQTSTWDTVSTTYLNAAYPVEATFAMASAMPHPDEDETWDNTTSVWDTSQGSEWGYIPPIASAGEAVFNMSNDASGISGFSFAVTALFDMSNTFTPSAIAIFVNNNANLSATNELDATGNLVFIDSITIGTTVNIPLPGTTTWNLETSTWDTTTGSWGYTPSVAVPVTAELTQIILDKLNEEDAEKIASTIMAMQSGVSANASVSVPVSGIIGTELAQKFNINFEESITINMSSRQSSDNNFLWNEVQEDSDTTWSKVADPDE